MTTDKESMATDKQSSQNLKKENEHSEQEKQAQEAANTSIIIKPKDFMKKTTTNRS